MTHKDRGIIGVQKYVCTGCGETKYGSPKVEEVCGGVRTRLCTKCEAGK